MKRNSSLGRTLKGDKRAFQVLFDLFYQDAYRSAYLITRNREQAEDATQEAFLKAFKRLDTLQEPKSSVPGSGPSPPGAPLIF